MNTYFWFIAGMLAGFSAALVALPLMRGALATLAHRNVRIAVGIVAVGVFGAVALILYRTFGSPAMLSEHVAAIPSPHPGVNAGAPGESAESMESVVAQLEARVARDGGKREDWLLLAQSYDFLGRAADAQRAREKADGGGDGTPVTAVAASSGNSQPIVRAKESSAEYERRVRAKPGDVDAWRALAGIYRQQHDYAKAREAFAKLEQLKGMSADNWADYADVLASVSGGSLHGAAARAIDQALELNRAHPKALWLKASLAHEERRYADALAVWKQLRAVLPPDSPDVRIVDANIGEATELAGLPASPAATDAARAQTSSAEVSGTVSIDRKLASRVPAGATLFIYAKAADSPGPPLAVLRQIAGTWPVAFRLDDTLAMIPTRKLSQFDKVIVEARVSRSGQAAPAAGDLYVTSAVLKPGDRKKLELVINHEVG
jgi:cytochrome c-type biogenesis protein CcmH